MHEDTLRPADYRTSLRMILKEVGDFSRYCQEVVEGRMFDREMVRQEIENFRWSVLQDLKALLHADDMGDMPSNNLYDYLPFTYFPDYSEFSPRLLQDTVPFKTEYIGRSTVNRLHDTLETDWSENPMAFDDFMEISSIILYGTYKRPDWLAELTRL